MVLPCTRELHFHFLAGPKQGSKIGAKMEPFGLQNLNYTRFGPPFGRNWGPKTEKKKGHEKCSKKVTLETRGCAVILRPGGGSPTKIQRSDLRREENLMDTPPVP